MKKIMRGNQCGLTELFAETLRGPLTEASAILTDRLQYIRWCQKLNLMKKMEKQVKKGCLHV